MHPIEHIRKNVLGLNQVEFAAVAGVTQATVSRWENGELTPDLDQAARIRESARARGIGWDDRWFWQVPQSEAA